MTCMPSLEYKNLRGYNRGQSRPHTWATLRLVVPLCYGIWAMLHARGPLCEEIMYEILNLYKFTQDSGI